MFAIEFFYPIRKKIQRYPVTWQKMLSPKIGKQPIFFISVADARLNTKGVRTNAFIPDVESELIEIENPSRLNVKNLWLSRTERRSQPLNFSYLLHLIRKPPKTKSWFATVHTEADGVILIYFPKFWRQRPISLTHFKRIQLMSYCCVHILDWTSVTEEWLWESRYDDSLLFFISQRLLFVTSKQNYGELWRCW